MRYYPAVGPAIPHTRVGRSRVTHPFAGRGRLPHHALDLHVLSTPPAFVLSQDQTLQREIRLALQTRHQTRHPMSRPESMMNVRLTLPSAPNRAKDHRVRLAHPMISNSVVKQHPTSSASRSRDLRLSAPILSRSSSSGSTAPREPTTTSATLRRPTHSLWRQFRRQPCNVARNAALSTQSDRSF
jgi:hypothetical protein